MSVKIIVDSASDLTLEEANSMGLGLLSMKIIFGPEEEYKDGVDITKEEFFKKMESQDKLPHTSQITPYDFQEAFDEALKTYDEVLCISMSSKLSGSYQNAALVASSYDGKVQVVDSENVCIGIRILIKYAISLVNEGKSAKEVADILNVEKKNVRVIALLDTLENLKKGGRISSTAAFVGALLNIKPVICIEDGLVRMHGKARGAKNGHNKLREYIYESGGVDFKMPYALAYSGCSREKLDSYIENSRDLILDEDSLDIGLIGATIGTHAGTNAIAVAYFKKK